MRKVRFATLFIVVITLVVGGCASKYNSNPAATLKPTKTESVSKQTSVKKQPRKPTTKVLTATECSEKYGVGNDALDVSNVDPWLKCVKKAEEAYGGRGPDYQPIETGSSILVDVNSKWYPSEMKLSNGNLLRDSQWNRLKTILPKKQAARDKVIDAFSRYWFGLDKFDDVVKVEPLRLMSGPYSQTDYVSLRGTVKNGVPEAFYLEFKYYGRDWIFAKDIKVYVDGKTWELNGLDFSRDNTDRVWEIADVRLQGKGLEVARAIAGGDDVAIRVSGDQYYHDFTVPNVMKKDIGAMLEALSQL